MLESELIEGRRYFWCCNNKGNPNRPVCANPGECKNALIFKVLNGKLVSEDKADWCVDFGYIRLLVE